MNDQVVLTADRVEVTGAPDEIKLLPLGVVTSKKGTFLVDDQSVDMILKEFENRRIDLVVDYEHQTLLNVQAPAGGWITKLYRGTDAIIGKVEWTARAKEYLKNREYRYLSPTIMVQKDRRVSAIQSVALTNTPAIDGMPAMCKDFEGGNEGMDLKKLAKIFGLAEDASEEEILKAAEAAAQGTKTEEPKTEEALAAEAVETVANSTILSLLELPEDAKTEAVTAKIMALKNGDTRLAERVAQLEAEAKGREADALIQAALKGGKISKAQEAWAKAYALKDEEGFRSFLSMTPVAVPMGKMGLQDAKEPEESDADRLQMLKNMGISAEDYEKYADKEETL